MFPPQASTYAAEIDFLIILIAAIVGFWFLLAEGFLFWLIFRFHENRNDKAEFLEGHEKHIKRWITIPHSLVLVCDVVIIIFAIKVWVNVKQDIPSPDMTVRVISQQWAWTFVHPGPDNRLDTKDDVLTAGELHIPKHRTVHFELTSEDVVHSFSVPVFRLKQDAIPGRTIRGWFKATKEGSFDIQCAEMCGIGHGLMPAKIIIENEDAHKAWMQKPRA